MLSRNWKIPCVVSVVLLAISVFMPLAAAAEQELHSQLRQRLIPLYQELMANKDMESLRRAIDKDPNDVQVIEEYVSKLPMSPMAVMQLDMYLNRWESVVPLIVFRFHEAWVMMHPDLAMDQYGQEHVDSIFSGLPVAIDDSAESLQGAAHLALAATVGSNRNVASTSSPSPQTYQGEIQLVVNPSNANQIVAAANTWDTMGGACAGGIQAVFYSSNGGQTWGYSCPPDDSGYAGMSCTGTVYGSDPALAWNDNNEVFLNYMLLCSSGASTKYAMVVARSTNVGATWTGQGIIKNAWSTGTLEDKNFYVIDNNLTSPFYGRHYTCWDRSNNEKSAYSSNNGQTWTEVDLPTPSGGGLDLGCDLAVQDNGTVHIVFDTLTCGANCTNERMFYTRSTNGGASWSTPVLVRDFNLVAFSTDANPDASDERGAGPFGAVDIDNSGGSCDGNLYATFTDKTSTANDSDIYVARSTNGGTSWGAPVKVNDDGLANRIQFHPTLLVDQSNGSVVVAWHDARNDAGNDAVDFFVGRSTDCGLTWENVQASAPSAEFNNSSISYTNLNTADNPNRNPNQYGEYMGLDAQGGKAYLAWTDSRHYFPGSTTNSQKENLGFAIVDFGTGGGNQAPVVTITAPADGSTHDLGVSVSFAGNATDAEDGSLSSGLAWTSSLDGAIGSGASFSTSGLSVGSHTITASVTDSGSSTGNDSIVVHIDDPNSNGPQTALYNSGLGAPLCSVAGSSCDSVALLNGRANLGPESNQPNTVDTCSDGTSGAYHTDESIDRIVVTSVDGSDMVAGATVRIDATVWAYSTGSSDTLDLYYAADASSSSWVYLTSIVPPGGGAQTLSTTYVLPSGAQQAVRGNFRYNGSVSSCSTGSYDDDDDLVFAVGGAASNDAPVVTISTPTNGASFSQGLSVSYSGSATDTEDGNLSSSLSWTSSINGAIGSGASFSTSSLLAGSHTITASVTDSGGKSGSKSIDITIVGANTAPTVTISSPANGSGFNQGQSVTFTGSATDAQDGSLTASLAWSSSLDGAIGSGGSFSTGGLSLGSHTITASVTDSGGLSDSDAITVTVNAVTGGSKVWMSFKTNTSVPGVGTVTDEDIVSYDELTGQWALEFDGSDVGLGSLEINGLTVLADGDLLLSFTAAGTVGGLSVDDSDIVRFTPTSMGSTTTGSFSVFFDGSDVGLTSNGEDVDAIALAPDGRLVISTLGSVSATGASGADEDLLIFTGTLGSATSGSFAMYFDGSDVALNTASSEDVDAAAITSSGHLLFSTLGVFSVSGASGGMEDVAEFTGTFGSGTSGSFSMRLDLSALGISTTENVGSLHIVE